MVTASLCGLVCLLVVRYYGQVMLDEINVTIEKAVKEKAEHAARDKVTETDLGECQEAMKHSCPTDSRSKPCVAKFQRKFPEF